MIKLPEIMNKNITIINKHSSIPDKICLLF